MRRPVWISSGEPEVAESTCQATDERNAEEKLIWKFISEVESIGVTDLSTVKEEFPKEVDKGAFLLTNHYFY